MNFCYLVVNYIKITQINTIIDLNILKYNPKLDTKKDENGNITIYCIIRKKFLILTPEEHVRQLFILYLIDNDFNKSQISVEKTIQVNHLSKRPDILIYDKKGKPYLVIECKAPHIKLDEKTIQQVGFYNSKLTCPYALITNGQEHYCFQIKNKNITKLDALPLPPH